MANVSGAAHMETVGVWKSVQPLFGKTDWSQGICAWKVPRNLSGFLASTPQPVAVVKGKRWQKYSHRASWSDTSHDETILFGGCNSGFCEREWFHLENANSLIQRCRSRKRVTCGAAGSQDGTQIYDHITPMFLWRGLKPTISYLSLAQLSMVKDALKLAFEAHNGQKRKSGEPYIIHPVEVARILGELEMDWETIVAGLLHDTVEDTALVSFELIEERYGPIVRRIVEGETKVSKLGKMQCPNSESVTRDVKADDLRQMFLAMTEEVRVIIVKLADRLHNMRTLQHMPPHKQRHIAIETLQVFAPLARLLGMYRIKSELEDLSFMYSFPDDYRDLKCRMDVLCKEQEEVVSEARRVLQQTISKDQFLSFMTSDVKIVPSCKELYSVYKKIQETKCSVDEIRDIAQLRMILIMKPGATVGPLCTAQQVCYHLLGLVHAMWPPVPQTMKDYIATPKPNGYQSLHTTVIPFGSNTFFPLEIQIRTEEMDKLAEWGIAALHSGKLVELRERGRYAGAGSTTTVKLQAYRGGSFLDDADIARRISWLNSIREWQEEFVGNMTSREFVDTITGDLLGSRVFVFTPKGEVKNLPKGATVVDYAYQIHTDVGNRMIAAKVNGTLVSPTHTLANAEVVEIVTYDGVSTKKIFQLHRQWLEFAKTRSARHKLTKFLKEQAALAAEEITADSVTAFVSDMEDNDQGLPDIEPMQQFPKFWLTTSLLSSTTTILFGEENFKKFPIPNYFRSKATGSQGAEAGNPITFVNGSANKAAEQRAVKLSSGAGNIIDRSKSGVSAVNVVTVDDNAKASIDLWRSGRVAMWEGSGTFFSVQWFSICCIDRKSMLAEVTAVLGAAGVLICACAAETDRLRGIGIMLFHIEANDDSLVDACSSIDNIEGVLDWSVGCSWQNPRQFVSTT